MQPHAEETKHFYWVDFLRGIAAISVLIWHYQHFFFVDAGKSILADRSIQPFYNNLIFFYENGHQAVQLFWVISGFVFCKAYLNILPQISGRQFMLHRIARLYPLHLITLCIVAIFQFLSQSTFNHFQIYPYNDTHHFILNLFFASHWGFEQGFSFNAPIWSVSVEIIIYAVFFLFLKFNQDSLRFSASLGFIFFILSRSHGNEFASCGMFFFGGCIIYQFWETFSHQNRYRIFVTGLIILCSMLWLLHLQYSSVLFTDPDRLMLLVKCMLLVFVATGVDFVDDFQLGRHLQTVGNITYGSYLWHIPIQIIILIYLEHYKVDRMILTNNAFLISFIALVIITAYFSFHYIERPLQHRVKQILR